MKETKLLKIAVIGALIGILLLLYISEKTNLEESNIASIANKTLDEKVKIKGYITSVEETPGLYILTVRDNSDSIKVIAFKGEEINLSDGDLVEVEGKVAKYKRETEVIADIIRIIK